MGEIADDLIEQGENLWFDHLAGHPSFPDCVCPYCQEDEEE